MAQMNHEDLFRPPVTRLASLLMECARQDPSLMGRVSAVVPGRRADRHALRLSNPIPAPGPSLDIDLQLEELVSVAMASARKAEAAVHRAERVCRTARRSSAVFAGIGAVGVLLGIGGTVDSRLNGLAAPAAGEIVADRRTDTAAVPNAGMAPQEHSEVADTARSPPPAPDVTPPVYRGPVAAAGPWQAAMAPIHRIVISGSRPAQASFVPAFRRDLRLLFRGSAR